MRYVLGTFWIKDRFQELLKRIKIPCLLFSARSSDVCFGSWAHFFFFLCAFTFVFIVSFYVGFSVSQSILKLSPVFHVSLTRFNHWILFLLPLSNSCSRNFCAGILTYHWMQKMVVRVIECWNVNWLDLKSSSNAKWRILEEFFSKKP